LKSIIWKSRSIGPTTQSDLFPDGSSAVGRKYLELAAKFLMLIGVTVSKGGTGFNNQDDVVYVPLSSAQKELFGVNYLSSIALQAKKC